MAITKTLTGKEVATRSFDFGRDAVAELSEQRGPTRRRGVGVGLSSRRRPVT